MTVDVDTEVVIERPREEVAAYAADPDNVPSWYENIESVAWEAEKPVAVGSRIAFVARFLGRRLDTPYEVTAYVPGEELVMRTAEGPFPMETSYRWADTPGGGTVMSLRNRGEPAGFSTIATPFMAAAMRRANKKDLALLKKILEARAGPWEEARRRIVRFRSQMHARQASARGRRASRQRCHT